MKIRYILNIIYFKGINFHFNSKSLFTKMTVHQEETDIFRLWEHAECSDNAFISEPQRKR